MNCKQFFLVAGSVCLALPALADVPVQRYGVISDVEGVQVEGGITMTAQTTSDARIEDEGLASFDLVAKIPNGKGQWTAYIEGNVSPRLNGVFSVLPEANGDAGTALDRDGKGRLQVSELHYSRWIGSNFLTAGLIDPVCIDYSVVANDETSQFLNTSFINNPTIAFPDYSLGACLHTELYQSRFGFNLVLSGSNGLGDNPNASYSELVDVGAEGKGVFVGTEMYLQLSSSVWRLGLWKRTADEDYLDGSGNIGHNYGAYLTTDHAIGDILINVRLGMANDEISEAASFAGVALEMPLHGHTFGVAVAQTGVSDNAGSGKGDTRQAEAYLRFTLADDIHITPSVQWIENGNFDNTGTKFDKNVMVYSARATYVF